MKKFLTFSAVAALAASLFSCGGNSTDKPVEERDSTFTSLTQPDWSRNAVIYEINWRQMTPEGTVEALQNQLPRLKDLGVDILWVMPVHPISELNRKGELGSYYAAKDYRDVNPDLGTREQFKAFIDEAHKQGFKVIIDWVPNHTGCDAVWVSEHPEYYVKDSLGNMVGQYDWTDVYKLDYSQQATRDAMADAMKFWVEEMGVDGFRCDVAMEVPTDFWDTVRPMLDSVKGGEGVFMLAEASKPELQKNSFNMGYNWPMKDLFSQIAATSGQYTFKADAKFPVKDATAIDSLLAAQAQQYPRDSYLMNMTSNHDLNSWEGTEFDRLGNLHKAFAVLSYTLPGMPLIYTGQETGMNRAFEFFKKDNAPEWEPRNDYFTFYQQLNALKHAQPALRAGEVGGEMVRYATTDPNIYVFSREADGQTVTVLVNLGASEAPVQFTAEAPQVEGMTDYFNTTQAKLPEALAPGEYVVLVNSQIEE
ncbi:MAG: alpha-amylase [Muribaculaceae bacterium]|nr:alpha-amylase [Muribaculaceae bacterium]